MINIRQTLDYSISQAISRVTGEQNCKAHVIYATRPEFGDYQANGVMAIAKQQKTNPRELAQRVVEALEHGDLIDRAEVAGPGFINLFLRDDYLSSRAASFVANPAALIPRAGRVPEGLPGDVAHPQRIVIDYSGPNLAKEMHVGHLRGTIIGDCIVRVLEAVGHEVIRQNHVGDWGTQFGMLIAHMESLKETGSQGDGPDEDQAENLPEQLANLEVFYRSAKEKFDADPEFAETARSYVVRLQQGDPKCRRIWGEFIAESLSHCEEVYERLNVTLTRADLRPESFYNSELDRVIDLLDEQGLLTKSEGAQCVFLPEFRGKGDEPLPAIVQKSDGGYLYSTTDLAAVRYRCQELKADRALYVVDARQSLHFQQVFAVSRKAGFASEKCSLEHIAYGTMMGSDGKPFKTRSGDTVKLQDLLSEAQRRAYELLHDKNPEMPEHEKLEIANIVGIASVKYADLSKSRTSDYVFDWSTMLSFDGNTAPYLLYAYTRICSILRKQAAGSESESGNAEPAAAAAAETPIMISAREERTLILKVLQFPEVINVVAADCYPNNLCLYLFELAGIFMRFYEACPVLKAEGELRASRLALAELTAGVLQLGLDLLGIETLERM